MSEIIGHDEVLAMFERAVKNQTLAHAYLLVGSAHVGKGAVARWLAARLLCGGRAGARPCGICASCAQGERGMHPDVLALSGAPVGVDAAREWVGCLHRTALLAGWKVGIVEGAESATTEAANACLKAIEEPPERTCIILTTTNTRLVLPTIASRCAVVRLRRVPDATLVTGLRARGVMDGVDALVAAADGCPGRAIAWSADPELRAAAFAREHGLREILARGAHERLRWVEGIVRRLPDDRAAAQAELLEYVDICRRIARAIATTAVEAGNASVVALGDLVAWMGVIVRAPVYLAGNVAPRLVLESLVLSYP